MIHVILWIYCMNIFINTIQQYLKYNTCFYSVVLNSSTEPESSAR